MPQQLFLSDSACRYFFPLHWSQLLLQTSGSHFQILQSWIKSKVSITPLKKTIYINQTCKINLQNNKTKVKWTVSNNKIRIVNKNNKYATIKGLKVGSAYIKAKIGKKTYRSKMTIKKKVVKTPSAPTVKNYTYNRIILDNDKLQIKLAYTTSSEIAFSVYNKTDSLFKFDCEYFKLNDTDYEPDEMTTSPYIASKDTRNFILKAKIKNPECTSFAGVFSIWASDGYIIDYLNVSKTTVK